MLLLLLLLRLWVCRMCGELTRDPRCRLLDLRLSSAYQTVLRLLLAAQLFLVFIEPPGTVLAGAYCTAFPLYCLVRESLAMVVGGVSGIKGRWQSVWWARGQGVVG